MKRKFEERLWLDYPPNCRKKWNRRETSCLNLPVVGADCRYWERDHQYHHLLRRQAVRIQVHEITHPMSWRILSKCMKSVFERRRSCARRSVSFLFPLASGMWEMEPWILKTEWLWYGGAQRNAEGWWNHIEEQQAKNSGINKGRILTVDSAQEKSPLRCGPKRKDEFYRENYSYWCTMWIGQNQLCHPDNAGRFRNVVHLLHPVSGWDWTDQEGLW